MELQNTSKIEIKQLNNLSDSWELKLIFGLVNSNRQYALSPETETAHHSRHLATQVTSHKSYKTKNSH